MEPRFKTCRNASCRPGEEPRTVPAEQIRRGLCMKCYQRFRRSGTLPGMIEPLNTASSRRIEVQWDGESELMLMREFCKRDFWTFFLYAFGDGMSPKGRKWIDPAIHEPMARWYQKHVEEWLDWRKRGIVEQKNIAVLVHREMGKSRMISAAGQIWLHLKDPQLSSFTGSESLDLSGKILGMCKAVLDGTDPNSLFAKLYGNWSTSARLWTAKSVTHAARTETSRADPSFGTFAVETSIVGAHPDAIFYDDPISYPRMLTDTNWLNAVNSQVSSLLPVLQSDGLRVWVGTRYDDEDHFGVAFRTEGIASIEGMPTDALEATEGGRWHVYFLAGKDSEGKPTSPKVWPQRRLDDYQRTNPLQFASQVMNDPELSEYNPITKEQIAQCMVRQEQVPWNALRYGICTDIAFWDGKSREKKDETVIIVHGYPRNGSGDVYVIECHASPTWRMEDFGHRLVSLVQRYRQRGRRIIGISGEVSMAGLKGSLHANLRNFFADSNEPMPPYHEFPRGGTKKVDRMVAAASFWVDGHVKVVEGAPGIPELLSQMSKIGQFMVNPRLRNDRVDAHSDAFQSVFYNPMKRLGPARPYGNNSRPIETEGLDTGMFDDSEVASWMRDNPRPPMR